MLMSWSDSMVTCWRLIKSPWVGKKIILFANIDRKNERTKKKATKINTNNSPSSNYIDFAHETTSVYSLTVD